MCCWVLLLKEKTPEVPLIAELSCTVDSPEGKAQPVQDKCLRLAEEAFRRLLRFDSMCDSHPG